MMVSGLTYLRDPSIDEIMACLDRDGCVVIEDAVAPEIIDALLADVAPDLRKTPFGSEGLTGARTRRLSSLLARSKRVCDLLTRPFVSEVAERVMSEVSYKFRYGDKYVDIPVSYQLTATQIIELCPGQAAQPLHRDDNVYLVKHPGPDAMVNFFFAATDTTFENGATMVVPGSHRLTDDDYPTLDQAIPATMKRGSCLIIRGSLFHGGGENVTDESRIIIGFGFVQSILRQEENQFLAVPLDTVRMLPRKVQEMMGYVVKFPAMGWVEMADPADIFLRTDGKEWDGQQKENLLY